MMAKYASRSLMALMLGVSMAATAPVAWAQHEHEGGGDHRGGQPRQVEPERGPQGYARVAPPPGAQARPQQFDRRVYNHNFTADHGYHIGPYYSPRGFRYQRWGYGDVLPRVFWDRQYWLDDYWLFGLDVPPVGFEWVRYGPDALLIDTGSGEVVQVIYGRFL